MQTGRRLVNTSCLLFYFQFKDVFCFAAPWLIYHVGLNPTCGPALPVISGVLSKRKQRMNSLLHSGSLFSLINTLTAWPVVSVAYSCWSALLDPSTITITSSSFSSRWLGTAVLTPLIRSWSIKVEWAGLIGLLTAVCVCVVASDFHPCCLSLSWFSAVWGSHQKHFLLNHLLCSPTGGTVCTVPPSQCVFTVLNFPPPSQTIFYIMFTHPGFSL